MKRLMLIALLCLWGADLHAAQVRNLRCEYLDNPLGIDCLLYTSDAADEYLFV